MSFNYWYLQESCGIGMLAEKLMLKIADKQSYILHPSVFQNNKLEKEYERPDHVEAKGMGSEVTLPGWIPPLRSVSFCKLVKFSFSL